MRLRNDGIPVIAFEFKFHLHMVNGKILSQLAPSIFCQPNDQLSVRVWRESLGKITLATVTMSPDLFSSMWGNKILYFK